MPMAKLTEEDYPIDGQQEYNDVDMSGMHGTMAAPTMRVHGVTSRNVFVAPECPIAWVTVYLDKAEVCRCVRLGVAAGELTEVFFTKLSPSIDKDSIRVEVKGPAIIQDVNYMARRLQEDEAQLTNAQHELKEKIKHAKTHQDIMSSKQKRLEKQRVVLDKFADTLIENRDNKEGKGDVQPENGPVDAFDPKHMDTLNSFFSLYGVQAEKLDEGIMQVKEEAEQTAATIKELEKALKDLELRHDEQMVRELSVLVEAREAAQIELYFSYVVHNVKWTPTYDIRIFNSDGNMKIVYYGLVQQATGEDWEASQLVLSTSQPGVGGTVPDLGVQRVHFKSSRNLPYNCPMSPTPASPSKKSSSRHSSTLRKSKRSSAMEPIMDAPNSVPSISDKQEDGELPTTPHSTLKRPSDPPLQSTQFEVPRPPAIIPCDNEQHRVTVALVDLNPTFEYVSAPKRSPFAYLKANVQNTSKYAFLPGQTNIYVDNNFIGKSVMNSVAPNEDFSCYLGADHAIKVSYNPMFKYKETTGTGGKNASVTFKQIIEIKNTHERPVKILVMDQLPMSAEDKIKVQLLEPVVKHPEKYDRSKPVRINKANNVEWDLEIQPNEVKELILRYLLEHPVTEEVDVSFSEV